MIITCSQDRVNLIKKVLASLGPLPVSEVGRITQDEGEVVLVRKDESRDKLTPLGFDHFRK